MYLLVFTNEGNSLVKLLISRILEEVNVDQMYQVLCLVASVGIGMFI